MKIILEVLRAKVMKRKVIVNRLSLLEFLLSLLQMRYMRMMNITTLRIKVNTQSTEIRTLIARLV